MKLTPLFLLLAAGVLTGAVALRGDTTPGRGQAAPQRASLPDTPETALFVRLCGECHDTDRSSTRRRTRAEWNATIEQMIEDGADGTDEEFAAVLEFLVGNFGAVSINTGRTEELVNVLKISERDAEAIVAYRAAKGPFADFEALKSVDGIDVSRLEARKSSIRFF